MIDGATIVLYTLLIMSAIIAVVFLVAYFLSFDSKTNKRDTLGLIISIMGFLIFTFLLFYCIRNHPMQKSLHKSSDTELISDFNYERTKAWAATLTDKDYKDTEKIAYIVIFNKKVEIWNKYPEDRPDGMQSITFETIDINK